MATTAVILGVLALLVSITYVITIATQPVRSREAFCELFESRHKDIVAGDNQETLDAYTELERIAPEEIRPSVEKMRNGAEIIATSGDIWRADAVSSGAVAKINEYMRNNCQE